MGTKQSIVAAGFVAAVLAAASGCSSTSTTAATTTSAVVISSNESDGASGGATKDGDQGTGESDHTESVALPDDWPDELALPADVVVLDASDSGGHSWSVVARVDGDPEATLDEIEANLEAAEWRLEESTFTDSPQGGFGTVSGQNRQMTVAISLGPDLTGDTTELTILLAEKTSQ